MSKKNTAKKLSEPPAAEPVVLDKVNAGLVEASCKAVGIWDSALSLKELVDTLQAYNTKTFAKVDLTLCSLCRTIGNGDAACAFCGDDSPAEDGAEIADDGKAIVTTIGTTVKSSLAQTEKALDVATGKIIEQTVKSIHSYWTLGRLIADVHRDDLWKARTDDNGKAAYKSFAQYVVRELKMSPPTAYKAMDVASKFTEGQITKIGMTKLSFILQAPELERPALLAEVEANPKMGKRQLESKVKQIRADHKVDKIDTGRQATPKGLPGTVSKKDKAAGVTKKTAAAEGRVTVAMTEGVVKLAMYAKPAVKLQPGEKLTKVAKQLGDEPIATEQMNNGVVRYYSIVKKDNALVLKIETKRL